MAIYSSTTVYNFPNIHLYSVLRITFRECEKVNGNDLNEMKKITVFVKCTILVIFVCAVCICDFLPWYEITL